MEFHFGKIRISVIFFPFRFANLRVHPPFRYYRLLSPYFLLFTLKWWEDTKYPLRTFVLCDLGIFPLTKTFLSSYLFDTFPISTMDSSPLAHHNLAPSWPSPSLCPLNPLFPTPIYSTKKRGEFMTWIL
jgi:hypothetical protein